MDRYNPYDPGFPKTIYTKEGCPICYELYGDTKNKFLIKSGADKQWLTCRFCGSEGPKDNMYYKYWKNNSRHSIEECKNCDKTKCVLCNYKNDFNF